MRVSFYYWKVVLFYCWGSSLTTQLRLLENGSILLMGCLVRSSRR
jgi:hypothetical protein